MFQAKLIELIPGTWECDSVVLDDGKNTFQLALPKSSNAKEYIGKEVIISIDGDKTEITDAAIKHTNKPDTYVDRK